MKTFVIVLILFLQFLKVVAKDFTKSIPSPVFCGEVNHFQNVTQEIETRGDADSEVSNCTWVIDQPKQSVIWLHILHLQLEGYGLHEEYNCLNFANFWDYSYGRICNGDEINFSKLSFPTNQLKITLELYNQPPAVQIKVHLNYTSYLVKCDHKKLKCPSYSMDRDNKEPCFEALFDCGERCEESDKEIPCGDICYNVETQRCNNIIDCYNGEDEIGCNHVTCPNSINCPNSTECITKEQICNNITDCEGGFDEQLCKSIIVIGDKKAARNKVNDETDQMFYVILSILSILSVLFMSILVRCYTTKKNDRRLFETPPRTPLPPFSGPGLDPWDSDDSSEGEPMYEDIDTDLKIDSPKFCEVYDETENEKSAKEVEKTKESREKGVTFVEPPPSYNAELYKKHFGVEEPPFVSEELIALASIKMTKGNCIGLRKVKSETDKKISKLLFLDHNDNQGESSTSSEEEELAPHHKNHSKPHKINGISISKSDTITNNRTKTNIEKESLV